MSRVRADVSRQVSEDTPWSVSQSSRGEFSFSDFLSIDVFFSCLPVVFPSFLTLRCHAVHILIHTFLVLIPRLGVSLQTVLLRGCLKTKQSRNGS